MTKDEMVDWHHQCDEFEQALGVGDGQGSVVCCSPRGCKELDMTELLNQTLKWFRKNVCVYVCTYKCTYMCI